MGLKHINAVIIGSGAGGGAMAKQLAEGGLSVVVLERGKWMNKFEHYDDEFLSVSPEILGPSKKHTRVVSKTHDGQNWITLPANTGNNRTVNNASAVGGGTQFYAGMAWRFVPEDFKMRSTYGEISGANLEDWPISYEDLAPYYERVEWEVGVAGDNKDNPFSGPMAKDYPMPAFAYDKAGHLLADAGKKLGLHPAPVSMFRNSTSHNGRPVCIRRQKCMGWNCPQNARNGSQNTTLVDALNSGNCEIRVECVAREIVVDDKGHAKGVKYFDKENNAQFQSADLVICSAGATESARLLLNSKSKLFPNGAGNNYDLVGRNFQGHLYAITRGFAQERVSIGPGPGRTTCFMDYLHHNPGIIGGGLIDGSFPNLPYSFARSIGGWGKSYKDTVRDKFGKELWVLACVQEMPVYESRVYLDPKVKDFWGIPVLRIHGIRHPNDFKVFNFLAEKSAEILKETGATEIRKQTLDVPKENVFNSKPHGQHQAGTCRMGNDKKRSVTNQYGQIHEIDNLFVCDAGLHVTNAGLNPSETIMALGFRNGEYIVNEWKGTKFK